MDVKSTYQKVFKFCCSRLSDRTLAEDVTQEAFLRFLEHPEYQGSGKEMQYLYTIARNLCIDEYRKVPAETLPEDMPDGREHELEWIESIHLREILDSLPAEEREIITLRYVSELSVTDIAAVYGVTWFSMNRRIKRILNKMRKEFGKEGLS